MKSRIIFLLSIFILISISCSLFTSSINAGVVETMVAATLTAQPSATTKPAAELESTPLPTLAPTQFSPENSRPAELRVAFIGPDRNLYSWSKSTGVINLMGSGDTADLKLSEDGELIAFTRDGENQQSSLWITGFDGSNPREVMTWNDLASLKTNPESLGASSSNLQWIPGTHILTFTSREVFEGPGMALNNDQIRVDGDYGTWNIKMKPGQSGVASFSPDGRWMAISTSEKITIMDIQGNPAPGSSLQFAPVATYSEYLYYPVPIWSADSERLAVSIPAADPLAEPRQPASVWTMDTKGGDPILQTRVVSQFIGPVSVSPDLLKLFYVKEVGQPAENRREIRTSRINGEGEFSVYTGGIPQIWDWNPNSEVFAYQTSRNDPVTVSQMNGSVGNLPDTNGTTWFTWVDTVQFLFSRVSGENAELYLGKWKEGSQLIAALPKSDRYQMQVDFAR